jgi:hypothetical protein
MSQNGTLHLAQEFRGRMGSGAEPVEIAKLFSENMRWETAGDAGVLLCIGQKSGKSPAGPPSSILSISRSEARRNPGIDKDA